MRPCGANSEYFRRAGLENAANAAIWMVRRFGQLSFGGVIEAKSPHLLQ
jgi:hypothetical protein